MQIGMPFFDLDEVIEHQEQKTIAEIFEKNGEDYFRQNETDTLKNIFRKTELHYCLRRRNAMF